ncbi:MAG: hypothetical protein COT92_03710 [Candidatus Doudnabacteria bacterium CG10_big_fil_rev_8_21_14_0_10_42_18]|uniref:Nudix hydrolase domain-containing protein n=1 Tax=Candidatus Doudnabacteria bacterium CG10_big_fil_rev_8_21_14_0_10_42_18 TaxID=1974552 RepID=A0A2H0VA32_9BACT|nr:MAG: hypothetical protein COT92_03710 [Candidatus Doudnabacteria bacterium CG10_big_fil_rev_8_21_14_0_10_42_18]
MGNIESKPIISAILLKYEGGEGFIHLQERWKPKTSPTYSGMLEIPAGGIDAYENIYDALAREVREECGLEIAKVIGDYQGEILEPRKKDKSFVFKPFICQQVLETNNGLPWIGFVFVCLAEGKVKINPNEARNPQWVSLARLKEMLNKDKPRFFPLQLPVLKYLCENIDSISKEIKKI